MIRLLCALAVLFAASIGTDACNRTVGLGVCAHQQTAVMYEAPAVQTFAVPTTQVQFEYVQPQIQVQLPPPNVTFSYSTQTYQVPPVQLQQRMYAPPVQLGVQQYQMLAPPRRIVQLPVQSYSTRVRLGNAYGVGVGAPPVTINNITVRNGKKGFVQRFRENKAARQARKAGGDFIPGR